jgi:hypothetical protein
MGGLGRFLLAGQTGGTFERVSAAANLPKRFPIGRIASKKFEARANSTQKFFGLNAKDLEQFVVNRKTVLVDHGGGWSLIVEDHK